MMSMRFAIRIVLGSLITLFVASVFALTIRAQRRSAPANPEPDPAVTVETVYEGGDAVSLANTIAAPIEQQVLGVEKMIHTRSRSEANGKYRLEVTFQAPFDPDTAVKLISNRVGLALPILPDVIRRNGVTVRKKPPGLLAIVAVSSPDSSRDVMYLSGFADASLKDRIGRLPGVGRLVSYGDAEFTWRAWTDPDKLTLRGVSASDVEKALASFKGQRPRVPDGQNVPPGTLPGGLANVAELEQVVVKTGVDGREVRVRDVASVELGAKQHGVASRNGVPVIAVAVHAAVEARPADVSATLRKELDRVTRELPAGVRVELAFDFGANLEPPEHATGDKYMVAELHAPEGTSTQRLIVALNRCASILRQVDRVQDVLTLTEPLFDADPQAPSIVIRVVPARANRAASVQGKRPAATLTAADIQRQLQQELPEMRVRVRDLVVSNGLATSGWPFSLAIVDEADSGADALTKLALELEQKLEDQGEFADVMASRDSQRREFITCEIDREKAKSLGLSEREIVDAVQAVVPLSSDRAALRTAERLLRLEIDASPIVSRTRPEQMADLKIRNKDGQMVPLGAVARFQTMKSASAIERLDGFPMVEITANLAAGVSAEKARARCDEVVNAMQLPAGFRVVVLRVVANEK
jgi:multidrug efflux pump subunit AcrB